MRWPSWPSTRRGAGCLGCLPTGWYPAGLAFDSQRQSLYVANVKGIGSRNTDAKGKRKVKGNIVWGYNTLDPMGTVSLIPLPKAEELPRLTETVLANNRLSAAERTLAEPRKDAPPRPVPERRGEPSVFKHVLYIIKENRTYDQVFGDIARGEGDPRLCIFGENVTPNHHKLADEFVLLDNFYCSGVLSADGHQWTDEAYVTDYIEKSFGGWPRSYPHDGNDAMAYAAQRVSLGQRPGAAAARCGFTASSCKRTVRWKDPARTGNPVLPRLLPGFPRRAAARSTSSARATIKTLEPYICPTAIGFPITVSDQYRAEQFIARVGRVRAAGRDAQPDDHGLAGDHTSGTRPGIPTPEAARGRQRPGPGPDRRGRQPQPLLAGNLHLRGRGRPAERLRPHRRASHGGPGPQPLHPPPCRRQHELQPDEHGPHDRADSWPAADEPIRRLGHADGELLCGPARLAALSGGEEQHPAWTG